MKDNTDKIKPIAIPLKLKFPENKGSINADARKTPPTSWKVVARFCNSFVDMGFNLL